MDRLERLVNLVAALLAAERPMSRHELRVRVGGYADDDEAFRRNFERDKDVLRRMGMPIEVTPLDPMRPEVGDGYRIPRDRYELPDPGLADDELAALRLAASAIALEGGDDAATTALRKLAGVPGSGRSALPAGGPARQEGPVAEVPASEAVAVFFSAVAEARRVRFGYRGDEREVDPWRLSFRNGQWYLLGFDHGRGDERMFRVDRVAGRPEVVSEPGAFARPAGAAVGLPPPWRLGDEDEVVAEVLVDPDQAEFAEAATGPAAVRQRRADGSLVLELRVTNRDGFRTFVLGFLSHAEVLGPPELRDELIAWLEALAQPAVP